MRPIEEEPDREREARMGARLAVDFHAGSGAIRKAPIREITPRPSARRQREGRAVFRANFNMGTPLDAQSGTSVPRSARVDGATSGVGTTLTRRAATGKLCDHSGQPQPPKIPMTDLVLPSRYLVLPPVPNDSLESWRRHYDLLSQLRPLEKPIWPVELAHGHMTGSLYRKSSTPEERKEKERILALAPKVAYRPKYWQEGDTGEDVVPSRNSW